MIFAFADPAVAALPIYVLDEASLPAAGLTTFGSAELAGCD